jgi:NADP-dependent 3-hydroxy acid dehydrogenase YdfG
MEKLKDKHVLVVGATGSIGQETARLLKDSGAHLFLAGRDEPKLTALAKTLDIQASQCLSFDMRDEAAIALACQRIQAPLDILINLSGIGILKPFHQLSFEDLEQSMSINFYGLFHLLKHLLPAMQAQNQGLIINVPGILGKTPMASACAYSASKYALNGFMKSLREELKRTKIRITQVYFGGVDTHFWDNISLPVQRDKMIDALEAARAIWFLTQQPLSGVVSEMVLQPFNHQVI